MVFGPLLFSVRQVLAQSILHHGIQLNLMFLGIERGPLVQLLRHADIEAALEGHVRRLALSLAERECQQPIRSLGLPSAL